jgi:hypothetical protein
MPSRSRSKPSALRDRHELLRTGRAAAQALRRVCPTALFVNVQLQFLSAPSHAAQSFILYPAAQAYFSFPCPYGDCDGIYDLDFAATRTLTRQAGRVTGTLECAGMRSGAGLSKQRCGLQVGYTITTRHEAKNAALRSSTA